jgi:hypothetical protein
MALPKTRTSSFPDFLGIGAQRAGTTWLYRCLKKHPDLWLPPKKEIHYFDRSPSYPTPNYLYPDQPWLRLFVDPKRILAHWSKIFDRLRLEKNADVTRWFFRYMFVPASDGWYASLFDEGRGKITGEISPTYAILDHRDVEHIARLMPALKVIFILRNPIDRTWSEFRRWVRNKWLDPELSFDDLRAWVENSGQCPRNDYVKTLSIWSSVFPESQIFVGFYDEICTQPAAFLSSILDFLGADSDACTVDAILQTEKVNGSPEIMMPAAFREYVENRYKDDIESLVQRFGDRISHWRVGSQPWQQTLSGAFSHG